MLTKKKPAHRLAFILDTFRYMEETQLRISDNVLKKLFKHCLLHFYTTAPSVSSFSLTGLIKSSRLTPSHMAIAAATKTEE